MFAERLKELRKKANITQLEFAKKFNVSNGAIGNWESGKRQPDSETLSKLADFFNVSIDYLVGRTDNPTPPTIDEQLDGVEFALYGEVKDMTEAQKRDVLNFIKFLKSQEEK